MEKITGNESAMPEQITSNGHAGNGQKGLTIKQEIAARAMQGLLSFHGAQKIGDFIPSKELAKTALEYTNALITELNKPIQ